MSAAPSRTERPCSRSFCASFPIVVVLPVPFTPTTRITLGAPGRLSVGRLAEHVGDLLHERRAEVAELVPRLQPAHELRGRAHADVALDQRLLEPLPVLGVAGIERRSRKLARERTAALAERVAQSAEEALLLLRGLLRPLGVTQ